MENIKNPETDKSSISQTEAYFDTLLKSQAKDLDITPRRKFRPLALALLLIVILISIYFAFNFYINATNVSTAPADVSQPESSGAYFDPGYGSSRERVLTGRISKSVNSTAKKMEFELLDKDGKNISYIYSDENDLNLSVGLTVEIRGELNDTADNGREIVEVTSIRLK